MQVGTVSAAAPDPSGGGTTTTQSNDGGTVYRQDPRGTGPVGTGPVGTGPVVVGPVLSTGGGFLTPDPNLPCTGTNQCLKYLQYGGRTAHTHSSTSSRCSPPSPPCK